jgi:hypothetical protein
MKIWSLNPRTLVTPAELRRENEALKRSRSFWRWMVVFLVILFYLTCHLRSL